MDPRKPWKGKLASLKHKKMSTRQELEYQNPESNGGWGGRDGENQNHSHFTSSIIWCEYYHRIIFLTCWVEIENMLSRKKRCLKKPVASRIPIILPTASSTADTIAFLTTWLANHYNYSSCLFLHVWPGHQIGSCLKSSQCHRMTSTCLGPCTSSGYALGSNIMCICASLGTQAYLYV